ncbi:Ammonium transporter Rh type A [Tetrabaena socialis]|uniref:Ammonium transporter Rh type A n=1 Tax=Tetrabaena socialis TaxID=47790 RepID=A0A2J8AI56_9CHLO|nr:Ammonium transporter Rh type A [Tetrabaena socialis]|eukprot:PNH12195.1 Ammonium transporter Rh type A [Tetrabaena socialis]
MAPVSDTEQPLLHGHEAWKLRSTFGSTIAGVLCAALISYAAFTELAAEEAHVAHYYQFLIHVLLMVFVGFGFLMTFLRKYALSAVGLNFALSAVVMLLAVLALGAVQQGLLEGKKAVITIDLPLLIDAAFAAGSAMISFGAVLGRATPGQLLWMLVLMVPLYTANQYFVFDKFKALDIGGSISIHAFGAYYGLAVSRWIATAPGGGTGHPKNGATPATDVTAMIGTLFLWILWPSFNGALGATPHGTDVWQWHCIANTILALLASCVAAFAATVFFTGRFDMVHVQNATLAGGVAMGSSASLRLPPAASLAVGALAGLLSVTGYALATPALEGSGLALRDTCGVHNLHGMPGVLGGLASALFTWLPQLAAANAELAVRGAAQPLWQLAALGVTVASALVGGTVVGWLVSSVGVVKQELATEQLYDDAPFWGAHEEESDGTHTH